MLGLRKLRDVGPGIFERDELEAAGQHDRVVERARLGTRPPIMRHPLAAIKPAVLLSGPCLLIALAGLQPRLQSKDVARGVAE
jgi:hypothetical protein